MVKIFVGLPTYKTFQDMEVRKLQEKVFKGSSYEVVVQEVNGMNIEQARQVAIDSFLKTDCDYFLNMDSDIIPYWNPLFDEKNPIDKLVECDKDVVGAIYYFRRKPCQPVYRPLDLQETYEKFLRGTGKFPENYEWKIPEKLFQCKWTGNGMKLVKRKVIEDVKNKIKVPNLPMIYKDEYLGEDWAFDQRATELGYTIWLEPSISLGHRGVYDYTRRDFEEYYGNIK